jgi:hypothetical protein
MKSSKPIDASLWMGRMQLSVRAFGRVPRAAADLRVLDELDGICPACVLSDVGVGVIDVMIFIEHHVLEHRAEAQHLEDVQLAGNAPAL